MSDLNRVILIGRLTRDPELRFTSSGVALANLSLAINRRIEPRDGEPREEVVFLDVTVWRNQAEACAQYLKKGRMICVEGRLSMDKWKDREGKERTKLFVTADAVQFLGGREEEAGAAPTDRKASKSSGEYAGAAPAGQDDDAAF